MEQEIIILEEDLRLAMLNNDVKKLDELIHNNLSFISPDGAIATKEMDLAAHRNKIQIMSELVPSEQVIKFEKNIAIVTVKMEITGTYGTFDISGNYRYLRIWSKFDDKWQIISGAVVKIS